MDAIDRSQILQFPLPKRNRVEIIAEEYGSGKYDRDPYQVAVKIWQNGLKELLSPQDDRQTVAT